MNAARATWVAACRGTLIVAALCAVLVAPCRAGALRPCESRRPVSAEQQDKVLRFAALVKAELEQSGSEVALIARSGVDVERFGYRTSHAGVALRASRNGAWSVRQLYFDCDATRPRLFDQGMAGFVFGAEVASVSHVSIVLLPEGPAQALERAALDDATANGMLGTSYSANAYAFSQRYQNCNQWVAEMLAASWGQTDGNEAPDDTPRAWAQRWLREQGYAPSVFEVGEPALMWLAGFVAMLHDDDHPREDIEARRFRVSMPAAIDDFVATRVPGSSRLELCWTANHAVIHRGWDAIAAGCEAGADDRLVALD